MQIGKLQFFTSDKVTPPVSHTYNQILSISFFTRLAVTRIQVLEIPPLLLLPKHAQQLPEPDTNHKTKVGESLL